MTYGGVLSQMKVRDILIEGGRYRIFCDLDGVLVNFIKTAVELTGINPDAASKADISRFWAIIQSHMSEGKPFFKTMEPMNDAMVLWNYIKPHNPVILSSTGERMAGAAQEKQLWVQTHLGGNVASAAIFTPSAKAKAQYAGPNHVLIDDRKKATEPWIAAGGIAILHISAANTISQLKELGI